METTVITTNHCKRQILYYYDLTPAQQKQVHDDMDYLFDEDTLVSYDDAQFVIYKGRIYDLGEFQRTNFPHAPDWLRAWDGYLNDSFFSGILVKYPIEDWGEMDTDHVIMGWYYC